MGVEHFGRKLECQKLAYDAMEILGKTHDGDDLTHPHFVLTAAALCGHLPTEHVQIVGQLLSNVRSGYSRTGHPVPHEDLHDHATETFQ